MPERNIAICVFQNDGRILAAQGHDDATDEHFFRPLGGELEPGETAEEALRREIREETGLAIHEIRLLSTIDNRFTYRGERHRETVAVFDAKFADPTIYHQTSVEIHEDVWDGPAQWLRLDALPPEPLYPDGLLDLLHFTV